MAAISVRNWKNKELRSIDLDPAVFDYPMKEHLVFEAVTAYQAAARAGTHKVKNRIEVSGGTKKLWRQKGTGRARVGDNRSPLWRHGGTVHGPRPRSYAWDFPKKMRRNALKAVLAQKYRDGQLVCLDSLALESPKTRDLEQAVRKSLGLERRVLFLSREREPNLELASRNHPNLDAARALGVSIVDLIECDAVVIAEDALVELSEVLAR
jgi:large subunit ribosomal protein L4